MRLNNTPPPKKHSNRIRFSQPPPFQTDLRWDSCICFLREVSALFGVHSIVDDPVRKSQGTNESTKKPEGPEGFKCEGFKWIFRYHNIYIYISISLRILDPSSWRVWTRITGVFWSSKWRQFLRVQWFSLGIAISWCFFTWGVLGSWSGLDNSD